MNALETKLQIARRLAPGNLFQPATVLWRVFEVEALRRFVRLEGRVLDLGCGDGSVSAAVFDGMPVELIGVEPDSADAASAMKSGLYRNVWRTPGDRVPEPDASFDAVFSNSVLEHIPDINPVIAESSRVLRVGGTFVITVPSDTFHETLAQTWFSTVARRRGLSEAEAIDQRLDHHRYWTIDEWKDSLRASGLVIEVVERYLPQRVMRAWQRLSNVTGGLAYELAGARTPPRAIQRRFGFAALDARVPTGLAEYIVLAALRPSLRMSSQVDGDQSGGLLITATRADSVLR